MKLSCFRISEGPKLSPCECRMNKSCFIALLLFLNSIAGFTQDLEPRAYTTFPGD